MLSSKLLYYFVHSNFEIGPRVRKIFGTFEKYPPLLHIMFGYQCDKAVPKNDTREVMRYHFIAVK